MNEAHTPAMERSTASSRLINLALMLPFLGLLLVRLAQHAVWRDEINAWAIAYNSTSLGELLHRVHYEAHPALWYLILYAASHISHSVWMLKLVEGLIATGIFFALALLAPLRRSELVLIFAGYYIGYQYSVFCRMYGLEVLFLFLYLWFRTNRPHWLLRNTLWLALLANVDVSTAVLSTGLLFEYLCSQYRRRGVTRGNLRIGYSLGIYALGIAVSVATFLPAKDISWVATGKPFSSFLDPVHFGCAFALWTGLPWFPQTMSPISLWDGIQPWPHGAMPPLVLALLYFAFRKHRAMAMMVGVTLVFGILFSDITGVAGVRHIGIAYLIVIAALWMLRFEGVPPSWPGYVLLSLAVLANIVTFAQQWGRPFVDDDAAAQWIVAHHLQDMPLIQTPDTILIGLPERLERPVYQLDCLCIDRVLTFHRRRDLFNAPDFDRAAAIPPRSLQAMHDLHTSEALFLFNQPLTPAQYAAFSAEHLAVVPAAQFTAGVLEDERVYIYRLSTLP